MDRIIRGIVRGNMIELLDPHGLADGELITLDLRSENGEAKGTLHPSGETIDSPFWDEILDEFYRRPAREKISNGELNEPPDEDRSDDAGPV